MLRQCPQLIPLFRRYPAPLLVTTPPFADSPKPFQSLPPPRCSTPRVQLRCDVNEGGNNYSQRKFVIRSFHSTPGLQAKLPNSKIIKQSIAFRAPASKVDLNSFPPERIRNFCITAHIDHGKTTLSTKLLEYTNTITVNKDNTVYLDKLDVEKERGITVKAQTASMVYNHNGEEYLLNLIDTPGHVDFSYEVSRSLRACEGAVLLVDALKGVQAQTMANFWLAFEAELTIIPALNKVDIKTAQIPQTVAQMRELFDVNEDSVLKLSGKTGLGVGSLFEAIVQRVPPPSGKMDMPFRALLFDSWFENDWVGVVCLVKIVEGKVSIGDQVKMMNTDTTYTVLDVGLMHPERESTGFLAAGMVGYVACSMKSTKEARVGDTMAAVIPGDPLKPFPGFKVPMPMVFGGIFPIVSDDYHHLSVAIEKLALSDPAVQISPDTNDILGLGFRCGFLGLLHMEVFSQRLKKEYATDVIMTAPSVTYKGSDEFIMISDPAAWPEDKVAEAHEPLINANIVCPKNYMGEVIKLCQDKRGKQQGISFIDEQRVLVRYILPLAEAITSFYDTLKSITSGYATFDYTAAGYQHEDLVKISMLLNGTPVGSLSIICHRSRSYVVGKALALKLKEAINRQQFEVAIQAALNKKVIARETIKAFRKDVTAKCYGGDVSRKRKLLEKQKEGKKRMKQIGNVEVPKEAFIAAMKV